jgi:hypothetical protein
VTTLIIGSMAAVQEHGCPLGRLPKDLDVFSDDPMGIPKSDGFWDDRLYEWLGDGSETRFATLDELYTIKHSHAYWELPNGSWSKHMTDMLRLEDAGAELIPELHDLLYSIWVDRHGAKRVDLDMDAAEFFDDGVRRKYDHDSVHVSVAYGDRPMYERFLKAPPSVMIDMPKVWAASLEDQIRLFREEVYATALERIVIPKDYRCSPRAAYAWALRRTITSLTKGRSARFIVANYREFREPDHDYVARHRSRAEHLIPMERKTPR